MKYLLTLIGEEAGMEDATPEEMQAQMGRWEAFTKETAESGAFISGEGLPSGQTAAARA